MACTCLDIDCTQSTIEGIVYCTCTNIIPDISCPDGCVTQILENGNAVCICTETKAPIVEKVKTLIPLTNTDYFKDVSFTVAYSVMMKKWLSYYSFKPNYYLSQQGYFQTGLNYSSEEIELGLWSHLLTNKSYQVFYGKKYPFTIEYPDKSSFNTRTLNNVGFFTEARRYQDKYNYASDVTKVFNKAVVFNNISNSGNLNLVPQKNNLIFNKNFPKTNSDNTQDILISNVDNFKWNFDYIFNRVKNNISNEANWLWDDNQIDKTINSKAVVFGGKRVLDRLEGDYFLINLTYDSDSRFKIIHKFSTQGYSV